MRCTSLLLLALSAVFVAACGSSSALQVGRPALHLDGYRFASVPVADADQMLGRGYRPDVGEVGDLPCGQSSVSVTQSAQQLTADYSGEKWRKLDVGLLNVLGGTLDSSKIESVRVELTTTRRASITVPSNCREPVIYAAVAGDLRIEYRSKSGVDLRAAASRLGQGELAGSYQVDEQRGVVSVTLAPDQFVAYRIHQPKQESKPMKTSTKLWIATGVLFAAGVGAYAFTEEEVLPLTILPISVFSGMVALGVGLSER